MPRGGYRPNAGRPSNAELAARHAAAEDLFGERKAPVKRKKKPAPRKQRAADPLDEGVNAAQASADEQADGEGHPFGRKPTREDPSRLAETDVPSADMTSLLLLQRIYRDPAQPTQLRMNAASTALPYEHARLAPSTKGKKDQQKEDAAETAANGRFKTRPAPDVLRRVV